MIANEKFYFQKQKKTDLQEFEELFIQPQPLANVVELDLFGKSQKKKNKKTKKEKHTTIPKN